MKIARQCGACPIDGDLVDWRHRGMRVVVVQPAQNPGATALMVSAPFFRCPACKRDAQTPRQHARTEAAVYRASKSIGA